MRHLSRQVRSLAYAIAVAGVMARGLGEASAQQATALDRFEPAPPGDRFLGVQDATVRDTSFSAGLMLDYAHEPLVARDGDEIRRVLSDHQLVSHLGVRLDLVRKLALHASMPFVLSQGGEAAPNLASADGAAVGDLRLGARFAAIAPDGLAPGVRLGLEAWLPTGDAEAYASAGSTRWSPSVGVSGRIAPIVWAASLAPRFVPAVPGGLGASEIEAAVAVGAEVGPLRIGPEAVLRTEVEGPHAGELSAGAEVRLDVVATFGPVQIGAAFGPGLAASPGTPVFRALLGVAVTLPAPEAGDQASRPGPDDVAARQAPAPTAPPRHADGPAAPPATDADGDGVPDALDACPAEAGAPSLAPDRHGCPEAVAAEPAPCAAGDTRPACAPAAVVVQGDRIGTLEPIPFRSGSAELDTGAEAILRAVAATLTAHPEIARVAVDGHTDDVGDRAANLVLSQRRSLAIIERLVALGIDARRLEARGFGSRQPIVSDKTPEARAKNRRVELIVRKRTERGAEGWFDGPAD
jgi:outer membrane protein OmpA-like peptidoglycan-associated protein